jgi:hypothetical protein
MVFGLAVAVEVDGVSMGVEEMDGVALGAGVESQRDRLRLASEVEEDAEETRGVASHLEELITGVASHF